MKVLLIGEYSGLFNNVKEGLLTLGHQVYLASNGDGYRDYPSDLRWDKHIKIGKLTPLLDILNIFFHFRRFVNNDVVMFVSTRVFMVRHAPIFNKWMYKLIKKFNKTSYICDCGLDYIGYKYWYERPDLKYYDYVNSYYNENIHKLGLLNEKACKYEYEIRSMMTGLIPIWYEYAQPYRGFSNIKPAIRIPINLERYQYKPNIVKEKIVFFHGLSRSCKGGSFILEAFDRLRNKYQDVAEFISAGGLPFEEYMKVTSRTNVILDDVHSYSFSMNALFAMARGIIYMGGAEPEGNNELGYVDCPVINLTKDVDQICSAIEWIIDNKDKIEQLGLTCRRFVEKYHNYITVAQEYAATWNQDLQILS